MKDRVEMARDVNGIRTKSKSSHYSMNLQSATLINVKQQIMEH